MLPGMAILTCPEGHRYEPAVVLHALGLDGDVHASPCPYCHPRDTTKTPPPRAWRGGGVLERAVRLRGDW